MALSKMVIFFLLLGSAYGNSKLPELIAKQSMSNLRLITKDGKFTYYQRRSGELWRATNYKALVVLKGKTGTNYILRSSPTRKRILIAKNEHYHTFMSPRSLREIYSLDFGGVKSTRLGQGVAPRLHLQDTWASFYNPYLRQIILKNLDSPSIERRIQIANTLNPYFVPEVVMLNSDTVLFTDISKKGYPGLVRYRESLKKLEIVYKLPTRLKKMEICLKNDFLVVGEFGLDSLRPHSFIFTLPGKDIDVAKRDVVYSSFDNDIGNLVCSIKGDNLYFVQDTGKGFEAVELNLKSKKIKVISDVTYATQIVDMDSILLLPYQGKHYVLLGTSDFSKHDLVKKESEK